jgi:hypothetical protein
MQYHNFYFNNSYDLLVNNGIPVFSVKTDAFTIRSSDLEKASKILNILNKGNIGSWRISKSENSSSLFASNKLEIKNNINIQINPIIVNNIHDTR